MFRKSKTVEGAVSAITTAIEDLETICEEESCQVDACHDKIGDLELEVNTRVSTMAKAKKISSKLKELIG